MKECKNADCGKCERCLDEFEDPIGCKSVESIEFEVKVISVVCILFVIIIYLIFKK